MIQIIVVLVAVALLADQIEITLREIALDRRQAAVRRRAAGRHRPDRRHP